MAEALIKTPTQEQYLDRRMDMSPAHTNSPLLRRLHEDIVKDALTVKSFRREGFYSPEVYQQIIKGITAAYRVYKTYTKRYPMLFLVVEIAVVEAQKGYRALTGEFNFNGQY